MAEAFSSIRARFQIPELDRGKDKAGGSNSLSNDGSTHGMSKELQAFLVECRTWYSANRQHLRVNLDYDSNDSDAFTKKRVDLYILSGDGAHGKDNAASRGE